MFGISSGLIRQVLDGSRSSARKRMILPLHKGDAALLQRMLNAVQPGTYIRPHRHTADRAESIIVLQGAIQFLRFDDCGEIVQSLEVRAGSSVFGVDIEGGIWHSFLAVEPDTVLFEVKPGPYDPETDKEFARWAPSEFSAEAEAYLQNLTTSS
ncbi:WbuC family cupin fold metalloprotein [Pontiella agarivorans]|uniref:WbuC family cupin fold metalloprotein n=1 Tax=Pontiella agarivorans TaxID=3038953 RepID=UPI002AD2642F|nr:WbuC family cupin fold metalloprotein [Pontiella agarivorans]